MDDSDKQQSDTVEEVSEVEWWQQHCTDEDFDNISLGNKLVLLFEILKHCEIIGDKVLVDEFVLPRSSPTLNATFFRLVFSQSLFSLTIIEYFLHKIDEATQDNEKNSFCGYSGSWSLGLDYFRLDGSSSCDNRSAWCKTFNNADNIRAR